MMNFNFNLNAQRRLQFTQPLVRNFSNVNIPITKSVPDFPSLLQNVSNSFLCQVHSNISPQKSFSNPNFVNKHNPNILSPHKIDLSSIYQPSPKIGPEPESVTILNPPPEQPKVKKQKTGRRTRKNAAAKRAKQQNNLSEPTPEKSPNMTRRCCSSPKKLKKELKSVKSKGGKSNNRCKPWHKFGNEMMDYDTIPTSPQTPNIPESCGPLDIKICPFPLKEPSESVMFSVRSSPIDICPLLLTLKQPPSCEGTRLSLSSSEGSPMGINHTLQRIRMASECESEDSFIVFCDQEDEESLDEDDQGVLSEDSSDASDTDDSEIQFQAEKTACLPRDRKKVSFRADPELCEVHPMVQWSYAYHKARKGPWEQIARDRARFRDRIDKINCQIGPIFCETHRDRIYRERFE